MAPLFLCYIKTEMNIKQLSEIVYRIYGVQDDRLYDLPDLFYYHQKWLLRHIDDKKNGRREKSIENLLISLAWYLAIISRFQIDLQSLLLKRYSFKCPYCLEIPCCCDRNVKKRAKKTGRPVSVKTDEIFGWQEVIAKIYPQGSIEFKNLEILREQDIFHQAFRKFRQSSGKRSLREIEIASVDYFVELLKIANNLEIDLASECEKLFKNGCFVCHKTPCECFYSE